uniref:Glycosyltransferase n=1 Tax=Aegilops tauschii subsp. strangulata TaxID=200361 RepID=A0A452ZM13_AEGTS
ATPPRPPRWPASPRPTLPSLSASSRSLPARTPPRTRSGAPTTRSASPTPRSGPSCARCRPPPTRSCSTCSASTRSTSPPSSPSPPTSSSPPPPATSPCSSACRTSTPACRPSGTWDKESDLTKVRMYQFKRFAEGRGVLVNSFDWLEPTALKALADGVCVPNRPTPRVYCIGPLVNGGDASGGGEKRHECLAWLDAQPEKSVVFLCFGSKGAFSAAQLKEIARGLESSGHRFLWAVRSPPEEQREFPEPDLERLLPAGFLERTRGRGMVVKNWVPQAEVVRHEAVGAFVTHCGWNSALEAIMSGLPMVCWPLYAEQAQNKVFMVEEMKIAVPLEGYEKGTVKAEEIEAKLRLVMETEEGRKLREMLAAARKMALDAIGDGGSSQMAFAEFLSDLENSSMENGGCNN